MTTKAELKRYRSIGHKLKPIVTISGNGLSDSVLKEVVRALSDHELIKIKVHADDRKDRDDTIKLLVEKTYSTVIQTVGNVALIHKAARKPNPKLSHILRSDLL
ncbi:MAG: RNA-binding protein [Candidatus Azotimanducaceae bacterium]|jgi:RNA-binding protein